MSQKSIIRPAILTNTNVDTPWKADLIITPADMAQSRDGCSVNRLDPLRFHHKHTHSRRGRNVDNFSAIRNLHLHLRRL
ncbi:hypothetical protein KC334_g6947 [Hortaea werneckii]|nr:hypothetical protein KC334_g6947 [Hortaea werneckii]